MFHSENVMILQQWCVITGPWLWTAAIDDVQNQKVLVCPGEIEEM